MKTVNVDHVEYVDRATFDEVQRNLNSQLGFIESLRTNEHQVIRAFIDGSLFLLTEERFTALHQFITQGKLQNEKVVK